MNGRRVRETLSNVMGTGFSHLLPSCLKPDHLPNHHHHHHHNKDEILFTAEQPLDETLGHSFCYVRSSARFLSPSTSDRFISPSQSLRFDDRDRDRSTAFRSISGASVGANTSTPLTFLDPDSAAPSAPFDCTSSFSALPLQPLPRGGDPSSSGFFLSGPLERGALSGPLDHHSSDARVPFSAPLGGATTAVKKKKRRKNSLAGIRNSLSRSFSDKKRPWVVPVGRKDGGDGAPAGVEDTEGGSNSNVQWALGKAGEDRVHVVVSEEHGWLFVGIYDGFNGPDAPEFLMSHLYRSVFNHLKGLFWDENENESNNSIDDNNNNNGEGVKRVTFEAEESSREVRRKLWEFLAEDEAEEGLDLSGSDRFAFSVDDAVSVSNVGSQVSRRWLMLSKLKQGLGKKDNLGGLFQWTFGVDGKDKVESRVEEERSSCRNNNNDDDCIDGGRRRRRKKTGPVDHDSVLRVLELALEKTEQAYLDLTDKVIDRYPELAVMGSCLLVVLMRDEDVYVMNVGDSRAIVAQCESESPPPQEEGCSCSNQGFKEVDSGSGVEGIVAESSVVGIASDRPSSVPIEFPSQPMKLAALQLSTDHSTSIEQEVLRIKNEHPDDSQCIVNDRVKGRLKVTRAFGAGFLKQPKLNDAVLAMFKNEFIGNAPYISWRPSLCHHKLGTRDQFLVLSSDGLYQYFSNQEVVSFVENFMEKFPDGDPAQHLLEELLNRAAKKAGMDFHDLLDIPQGDRRKYHDDVTVMVISLEGRIWKSSGKYP